MRGPSSPLALSASYLCFSSSNFLILHSFMIFILASLLTTWKRATPQLQGTMQPRTTLGLSCVTWYPQFPSPNSQCPRKLTDPGVSQWLKQMMDRGVSSSYWRNESEGSTQFSERGGRPLWATLSKVEGTKYKAKRLKERLMDIAQQPKML